METAIKEPKDTTRVRRNLLRWYRLHGRDFPWRAPEPDPYVVMVSEVMLQQTQASRVADLLPAFLDRFPTVHHLAQASNAEVVMVWKGLGYNSRALRLRDAARMIVNEFQGSVPSTVEDLLRLPGIGPYASAAISTFAFDTRVVVLDVNVRRVYSRLFTTQPHTAAIEDDHTLSDFAARLIPRRHPSEWHHAVMDLGATVCMARRTLCSSCPLRTVCPSRHLEHAAPPPTTPRKTEPMFRGQPRRLWRGRVVQALRSVEGRIDAATLQFMVFGVVDHSERVVVDYLLRALESDSLITRDSGYVRLTD